MVGEMRLSGTPSYSLLTESHGRRAGTSLHESALQMQKEMSNDSGEEYEIYSI